MADRSDLTQLIKIPILIALAVTVVRVVVEVMGAPTAVTMIFGVA